MRTERTKRLANRHIAKMMAAIEPIFEMPYEVRGIVVREMHRLAEDMDTEMAVDNPAEGLGELSYDEE